MPQKQSLVKLYTTTSPASVLMSAYKGLCIFLNTAAVFTIFPMTNSVEYSHHSFLMRFEVMIFHKFKNDLQL